MKCYSFVSLLMLKFIIQKDWKNSRQKLRKNVGQPKKQKFAKILKSY